MAKKQFFIIIDTETTQDNLVADFGAVVADRKGNVVAQCGVLVNGIFTNPKTHPLFFDSRAPSSALWSKDSADARYAKYTEMVENGSRMVASVNAINKWLGKVKKQYDPVWTAYNSAFDAGKCENTAIDLSIFKDTFCLWACAFTAYAHTKAYREMVVSTTAFNAPTTHGNMSYKTNAETMTRFVLNDPDMIDEPHTALEDALLYELPILKKILKTYTLDWCLHESQSYNWRSVQVRDWFVPK